MNKKYPPRIETVVINHKYISYPLNTIQKETIIPFDCYIKRYNDFVIIIEAGTFMSEEFLQKLHKNKEIYILNHDSQKVNQYKIDHNIIDLSGTTSLVLETSDNQLSTVYSTISNLMQTIFDTGDEKLPLDALRFSMIELVNNINLDASMIPMLLKIIPDEYSTHSHSTNVSFFSIILAKALDLSHKELVEVGLAGLLHDIGKLRIDNQLLLKPSRLEVNEFETVKHHSEYGYSILNENGMENQKILDGVHLHHERLDGSGYPKGLHDRLIPQYAKIVGMCDAFDALTTKRTFRNYYTSYEALLLMKKEMATQFDHSYINIFIKLLHPH